MDVMDFVRMFFQKIWALFGINFPGFDVSIGAICIGALFAVLGLKIFSLVVGFSFSPVSIFDTLSGEKRARLDASRSQRTRKFKIANERKGDTR